jgi:recombination protein RecA
MAEAKKPLTRAEFIAKQSLKHGKGSFVSLATSEHADITQWASTGIYGLDDAMGWGVPGGRVVEWFGAESSGKTTALMATLIENARLGGQNFVADPEGTFDRDRYAQMGGKQEDVTVFFPPSLEDFYEWAEDLVAWAKTQTVPSTGLILIGLDTLTMMLPKEVLKAEADDRTVGAAARVNSQNLPKLDDHLGHNTAVILLSQVRDKIGSMAWSQEGNIDTPGGRIVKHASSVRVLFNKEGQIDNGGKGEDRIILGMKTKAKVVKSKVGPPLRKTNFRIMFDHRGVDNVDHCLQSFIAKGIVGKPVSGIHTITLKDKVIKFRRDGFHEFLQTHPKWTAWALEQTFELFHSSINLERYLGHKVEEGRED